MADIFMAIQNQADVAMSSINGELIVVLVARDGFFQTQQPVQLRTAMALFLNIPARDYTIVARHPDLTPTEARYDIGLAETAVFGIRFIYNEPDRRLLRIDTQMRFFS
ncbi:hypothetical protein K9N68_00150 [Kovacikia minuta CCNUW1]|uniref:hypothetical protein n=1 Tax=Kovacikia minuta TaxID=2931930 RepID=UPI001CC98EBF|nr:hypothetical protein [Kovacikia minuta]UBF26468.1 hypothetical protein K9N68_00150 [Kovacikia minuta CCNUW1]